MILIFEQDTRTFISGNTHFYCFLKSYDFVWKPLFSKKEWEKGKHTRKISWGIWSLSYYPEKNLDSFFESVTKKNTRRYYGRAY